MGFFSKKSDKKEVSLPRLPELPSLPSTFPKIDKERLNSEIHELPSFPNSGIGNKFSQETIKNAILGKDEEEDREIIPKPEFNFPKKESFEERSIKENSTIKVKEIRAEKGPVFIRIDKFEEAIGIFKETKRKMEEIEKLLGETKELKKKEEEELISWENQIQEMKHRIEKVDKDIFSKI